MVSRILFVTCLVGFSGAVQASPDTFSCHGVKGGDLQDLGSFKFDLSQMKVKASQKTYGLRGETLDLERIGGKAGYETFRANNEGQAILTFYFPEKRRTFFSGMLTWWENGDGDHSTTRYGLLCGPSLHL